ncbi:MAG: hypothetical protein KBA55_06915 [Ruminococcus sp.]|nr:hypothetical protein [Ruminococcus sp.]
MIRVGNIRVPLDADFSDIAGIASKKLKIPRDRIKKAVLSKKSVDARKKSDVHFIISVDIEAKNEEKLLKILKNASVIKPEKYNVKFVSIDSERPVIVGFGPAGMFAALVLAMSGARPVVLERGGDVDSRCIAVDKFRSTGVLDTENNIQFGEGGAGTFSDGKLTTGIKDRRISWILRKFVEFGAPDEILYMAKPHIGTDKLRLVVKQLRERVISLGGEVRFGARFCGFTEGNGHITSVKYEDSHGVHSIDTGNVILATGHSARDVFEMLCEKKFDLSQKNFAVGVRIEHPRKFIDKAMYGGFAGHPALKAADYKLAVHLPNGKTLYTFCMCPGGEVVAASSECGRLAVNGMSCFARDAENSNSALLVNVDTSDLKSDDPLAGMYLQRDIEEKAFKAGGSDYSAPVMTVGELLGTSDGGEAVKPSYRPGVKKAHVSEYLPGFVCDTLKLGIPEMGKKIKGFDSPSAVLTGVESRSSSPVRINRGEDLQSLSLKGLYPCGEGAGYAGGIISAAVDGMKCAECVIDQIIGK